ncbi:MAG: leucine-rich repeat domain-containing protein [Synergistaceae bacterium]|jgi:hypothetical protein|nr:leucine-rich repeat domain-containing protein [Synergistaceae bacterium]
MKRIEAKILNNLCAVPSPGEDSYMRYNTILNTLRRLMNCENDPDVRIIGNLSEEAFGWLWITTPLDDVGQSEFLSQVEKKHLDDIKDIEWSQAFNFDTALFWAAKKSQTKFSMEFSTYQESLTGFPRPDNNSIFQGKIWKISAENAKAIGYSAFSCFNQLEEVSLPSAEIIGDSAFFNCSKLKKIDLTKAEEVGEYEDPRKDYFGVFCKCKNLTTVNLSSAKTIGNRTFMECCSLEGLNLPKAEIIGVRAAYECEKLTAVQLPEAKIIGLQAFYKCENLTTVQIPKVETVDNFAFGLCKSITELSLDNVTTIGESAFSGCEALRTVYAPKVVSIGKEAFANCLNLREVRLPCTAGVSVDAFNGCDKTKAKLKYVDRSGATMPEIKTPAPSSDGDILYMDTESLNWDKNSISSFFKELDRQKKTLGYALTIDLWQPEESIPIASVGSFDVEAAYKNIEANITSDFGKEVICQRHEAAFLLSGGQKEIEGKGLLLRRSTKDGLDYAGLYVIFLPIGLKGLTVQIYTLYLSRGKDAISEGKQAMALKQNADPIHGKIIHTLRDTVRRSIDKIVNPQPDPFIDEETSGSL